MKRTKVIIFDLGGVIFSNGTRKAVDYLKNKYTLNDDLLEEVFYGKKALDFRKGKIEATQFWQYIDSILPKKSGLTAADIKSIWYNFYLPPKGMFDLIEKLGRNYKLGIISGNIKERVDYLDEKYDFRKYFNFEIYSFNLGANKPALLLYQKALEKTGVKASNCLYIDDHTKHLEPASRLGMQILLFKSLRQLLQDLAKLGIKW